MCAALSAGASLTPSPVIATTSPAALSARTSRSFCSGTTRAKTSHRGDARRERPRRRSASSSAPVSDVSRSGRPAGVAIARAVPRVVAGDHHDATPAAVALRDGGGDAARTDRRARRGRATRSRSRAARPGARPAGTRAAPRRAPAIRRSAMRLGCARRAPRRALRSRWQRSAIASGAPLVATTRAPPSGRAPHVRHREQLVRERVLAHERPVAVQVLGPRERFARRARRTACSMGSNGSRWLARSAYSTSAWTLFRADAPSGRRRQVAPSTASGGARACGSPSACRSCRRRGPSRAERLDRRTARRVSTRLCDIRQAPSARKTVRMTGNSSGRSAIASASPASRPSRRFPRARPHAAATARQSAAPAIARTRTQRAVSRWRGVFSVSIVTRARPMRPISVRAPVAWTRHTALPRTASVPDHTNGRSSPPGRGGVSPSPPARFPDGSGLPGQERLVHRERRRLERAARRPGRGPPPRSRGRRRPRPRVPGYAARARRARRAHGGSRGRAARRAPAPSCPTATARGRRPRRPTRRGRAPPRGPRAAGRRGRRPRAGSIMGSRRISARSARRPRRRADGSSFGPSRVRRTAASASVSPGASTTSTQGSALPESSSLVPTHQASAGPPR